MIKVPATPEGIPAIRALTAQGVSVNVTLIFSLAQYEEVVRGVSGRARGPRGRRRQPSTGWRRWPASSCRASTPPATSCSRRSARGDRRTRPARVEACSARSPSPTPSSPTRSTSRRSPARAGSRSRPRARSRSGCSGRRPAPRTRATRTRSTSTRSSAPTPSNTVPPATLDAFMDHGKPAAALARDLEEAHRQIEAFAALGLDLGAGLPRAAGRRREGVRDLDDDADARDRRAASGAAGEQRGERAMTADRDAALDCPTRCARGWPTSASPSRRRW